MMIFGVATHPFKPSKLGVPGDCYCDLATTLTTPCLCYCYYGYDVDRGSPMPEHQAAASTASLHDNRQPQFLSDRLKF
jgi:hypothetical protein